MKSRPVNQLAPADLPVPPGSRDVIAGAVFQHAYPFVRDTYDEMNEDGWATVKTWKPGVRMENIGPEDVGGIADGIGAQRLTVIDTFKPGRFPKRVFFTRIWIDPNGKEFGNGKLRIATLQSFRVLAKGYRHEVLFDREIAA